jgi:hypothetical protein
LRHQRERIGDARVPASACGQYDQAVHPGGDCLLRVSEGRDVMEDEAAILMDPFDDRCWIADARDDDRHTKARDQREVGFEARFAGVPDDEIDGIRCDLRVWPRITAGAQRILDLDEPCWQQSRVRGPTPAASARR